MQADLSRVSTLAELFTWRVQQTPAGEAYREYDPVSATWVSLSWAEAAARIAAWGCALAAFGQAQQIQSGARIAILLPNGINAVCIDQASLASGYVPVPLHAIDNPGSIAYILNDSAAAALVVGTAAQWAAIASVEGGTPLLKQVIVIEDIAPESANGVHVVSLRDWLQAGSQQARADLRPPVANDLATIVYTSGTTGKPKGVALTHRNVMANIHAVMQRVTPNPSDIFLSFLPLSHTFERTAGYYLPIAGGSCVAYARSTATIADDLKKIHPTVLISVPRIYERFYAKIQESLEKSGKIQQYLFTTAQNTGWRRFCRVQGIALEGGHTAVLDNLLWPLLNRLVAAKIRALYGGRVRAAVSGGAPMSQAVAQCFIGMGLPLLQGYGMTETSPVVSANGVDDNWPATVGKPLVGVEVRVDENRELMVRSASVMQGYWNRPDDTQRVLTEDGWLHTGDQATIENGRIRIIGRIKEIIVTSTGEKITPGDLELAITANPLFDQAVVFGENRPFIVAFLVLNRHGWETLATRLQVSTGAASLDTEPVREEVLRQIRQAAKDFPHYSVPRAVRLTLSPWTIENSLMTPTLKLKRNALAAHFAAEVDAVYQAKPQKP